MRERTWICCHYCRWTVSVTYRDTDKVDEDGFCKTCGEPAGDPLDKDDPYEPDIWEPAKKAAPQPLEPKDE